jgi:FtsZ-binding cell division protein ZapB
METCDRLESSVLQIIEAYRLLKEERDSLKRKVETADGELRKAGETIQNLQLAIENYKQTENDYRDLTDKKNKINEHIKTIIQRIDSFEARKIIDQVTNV